MAQWEKLGRHDLAAKTLPDLPPFPDLLAYLWADFIEIYSGCPGNGMGAPIIGWSDIRAWSEQMSVRLEPWEAKALIRIGHAQAKAHAPPKPKAAMPESKPKR